MDFSTEATRERIEKLYLIAKGKGALDDLFADEALGPIVRVLHEKQEKEETTERISGKKNLRRLKIKENIGFSMILGVGSSKTLVFQ